MTLVSLPKTLLSFVDHLFMFRTCDEFEERYQILKSYSVEDIAEAFSFILYKYHENFELNVSDSVFIDEEFLKSDQITALLIYGCIYRDLQEIEILVDHFNYRIVRVKDTFEILAPTEDFEK